jgi:hypothetical protein
MDIKIQDLNQVVPNLTDLVLISQDETLSGSTVEDVRDKELRAEVETARGTYADLGTRLDGIDASVLEVQEAINPIDCGTF